LHWTKVCSGHWRPRDVCWKIASHWHAKLLNQAQDEGHRLLAESSADREREFQEETNVVRDTTLRMGRVARDAKRMKTRAE
jgi:hypothetical protein